MGTEVHFVSYVTPKLDENAIRAAMKSALAEVVRIENLQGTGEQARPFFFTVKNGQITKMEFFWTP